MKKNSLNPKYFLFLLLVPFAIFLYFFKIFSKKRGVAVPVPQEFDFVPEPSVVTPNGLNDRQMAILEYMRGNNGIGRVSEMVTLFSQTDRTLRRDLNKLEALRVVIRSGSTKSVVYSLAK